VEDASATPLITGVPVLLGLFAVTVGTGGAAVSTSIANTALAAPVFPEASVAFAVSEWLPSANVDTITV